jgi:diguanylate cyclase (GGDEF)-like protein
LQRAARLAALAVQHRRMKERLSLEARRDPITDLPNRLLLSELLEQASLRAKRGGASFALLAIQLQPFAQIVDTYGHAAGDILLKAAAERLRNLFSGEQIVARLSGGTFVILWNGINRSAAEAQAHVILRAFAEPFSFLDHSRQITVRIGIGLFPEDGSAAGELLRDITAALRLNSKPGRSSIQTCAFETALHLSKRLSITKHLDSAAERGEFHLVYQPQVTLRREVVAVEALLCWSNPHLGQVSPAAFIPVAEESGLIFAIDLWVLRNALQQAHQWQRAGLPVRTAINVSAAQFTSAEFVESVRLLLREIPVDPQRIELEITEGVMMQNPELAAVQINKLRALGVRTAIDDFGAGYSSLSYLRQLPVHCVKIDRSFLEELPTSTNSLAILGAVIELSHQLGLEVLVEGVETEAQLQLLAPLRPDLLQGFLFHQPMPPQNAESLLLQNKKASQSDLVLPNGENVLRKNIRC